VRGCEERGKYIVESAFSFAFDMDNHIEAGDNMKGENERLLWEFLNDAYPGQWESEHRGIEAVGINKKGKEYKRKFSFDAANPIAKIFIEIEGGIWLGKGHTGGVKYTQDMEKYNLATKEGWRMLRYSPQQLKKHPEQIILDVMALTGCNPIKMSTRTTVRAKIVDQTKLGSLQVRLS